MQRFGLALVYAVGGYVLADRRNVEARLHAIAVGRAAVRAQIALSDGTLQACDAALADAGAA